MTERERTGLSQGAEELAGRLRAGRSQPLDCDVLIVGSGYGGAVAAARLAGATDTAGPDTQAARIWLLERGREHLPGTFAHSFAELPGAVRFGRQDGRPARGRAEALLDLRIGKDVSVLLGNGLGGGSLINAGVMLRPLDTVFDAGWPAGMRARTLAPAFAHAEAMLGACSVPQPLESPKLHELDRLAGLAGAGAVQRTPVAVHWAAGHTAAGVPMSACWRCGGCFTGCNHAAKGTLDTNYLACAAARGVQMFCGGVVEWLEPVDADDASREPSWRVWWHATDPALRPSSGQPLCVRTRRVLLAAGTLGSTEILLRSRERGLRVSARLGEGFSANGDRIVAAVAPAGTVVQATPPAHGGAVGPTITGKLEVPATATEPGFLVEEFSVPAALGQVLGETVATLMAFQDDGPGTADRFALDDGFVQRIGVYGLMGDDGAGGRLQWLPRAAGGAGSASGVEAGIAIHWPQHRSSAVFAHMDAWIAQLGQLGQPAASTRFVPDPKGNLIAGLLASVSVHPLGGCRMADDVQHGVVNAKGQVFRADGEVHSGLAVLDGAIVPCALGVNPALTIAALAEHALPALMQAWGLSAAAGATPATPLPPRPLVVREAMPSAPTHWSIRERLCGPCTLQGQHFWAVLDVELAPIAGWRAFLASPDRNVQVQAAQLRLWAAPANIDAFSVDLVALPLRCTATLTGQVRLFQLAPGIAAPDPKCSMLHYALRVSGSSDRGLLAVGASLVGIKHLGPWTTFPPTATAPTPDSRDNPWRQLSEMEVSCNGAPIGRWTLDFDDLADRREPLLRITQHASMPDALADLGALALYLLRREAQRLVEKVAQIMGDGRGPQPLAQRLPGVLANGAQPQVTALPGGASLARYLGRTDAAEPTPVLLIHGLGTSGASFTHAAIGTSLADHLQRQGRELWVLDVRSSVGNERDRQDAQAATWTVDRIAVQDLPLALDEVVRSSQQPKVDVVAHCMGAVMFCIAALSVADLRTRLRSVVLSQVGPLLRLSPMNRLRGYIGAYLQEYLGIDELDTRPDLRPQMHMDGRLSWDKTEPGFFTLLLDALAGTFPLPDDDTERARFKGLPPSPLRDFRHVRHRADAMFGQLFELRQLNDATLTHLDALLGWVKVGMLTQGIHFARQNLLTNARGRNRLLDRDRLRRCFDFPLLIVHGKRNRVFDWRGSLDSLRLLSDVRGEVWHQFGAPLQPVAGTHFGAGNSVQMALLDDYGHLDCLIGNDAHTQVFPLIDAFHHHVRTAPPTQVQAAPPSPSIEAAEPWWGPMLGWVRPWSAGGYRVRLLARPDPRRTKTQGVAIVPMQPQGGTWQPDLGGARVRLWDGEGALDVVLRPTAAGSTYAFLTLHASGNATLHRGRANALVSAALRRVFSALETEPARLQACLFTLDAAVRAAADLGRPVAAGGPGGPPAKLCFALGSCQYPPGLFDEQPAGASLRRLAAEPAGADGPAFVTLIGDQIYADATGGVFEPVTATSGETTAAAGPDYDRAYELNWRLPAFRAVMARLPLVPMLDDHEVADNWQGFEAGPSAMDRQARRALVAYRRHQGALAPERALRQQDWRSFHFYPQGVPFFVLDTRTHRSRRDARNAERADILQDGVLDDLLQRLQRCPRESVKFVVSPSPVFPPERLAGLGCLRSDTWSGFPAARARLLHGLCEHDIRRVVFLSGDSHMSSVSRLWLTDGPSVVSIVASGLYTPWPFANQQPHEVELVGRVDLGTAAHPCHGRMRCHALSRAAGYARIGVDQGGQTPRLRVDLCAADGHTTTACLNLR
ncbi:MAG: alpha/beta fold hydrolase [Rubrivivax sp.]|nr:alpha/beta fold hydrolase [Rubrivivax sp.]